MKYANTELITTDTVARIKDRKVSFEFLSHCMKFDENNKAGIARHTLICATFEIISALMVAMPQLPIIIPVR